MTTKPPICNAIKALEEKIEALCDSAIFWIAISEKCFNARIATIEPGSTRKGMQCIHFPNSDSWVHLATSDLIEYNEDWPSDRSCINIEAFQAIRYERARAA